ncbi:Gfo/Idh/MocA family protein [Haloarcula amylovorans]|uniref:Gfo/Idh/MocA family protein n=1 Tax=Haloarcula amylovorans TaxID=2562280 RepID=UPI00107615EC|nr:Gfo/Idh/MocA family oxidoreductase [Halomicroarcula amylolytica]
MGRYSIGILGTGNLGTALGREFVTDERAELRAIAEINEEVRVEAGKTLGIPSGSQYDSLEDMLTDEDLDALAITTPHTLHFDQIQYAFDEGLHILCEKPLVTTVEDAETLVERDKETDSVLMVGYQRHLESQHRYLHNLFSDGGPTPTYISAEIAENWIESYAGTWRTNYELSGGGFMFDTGSHLIEALLWVVNERPKSVSAEMDFYDENKQIEANASVRIRFENGSVADLTMPGDVQRLSERLHIWDDEGSVYVDAKQWRDYEVVRVEEDGTEVTPDLASYGTQTKVEAFLETIETGSEPPVTAEDALRALAVTEAAYESNRTGKRVPVSYK